MKCPWMRCGFRKRQQTPEQIIQSSEWSKAIEDLDEKETFNPRTDLYNEDKYESSCGEFPPQGSASTSSTFDTTVKGIDVRNNQITVVYSPPSGKWNVNASPHEDVQQPLGSHGSGPNLEAAEAAGVVPLSSAQSHTQDERRGSNGSLVAASAPLHPWPDGSPPRSIGSTKE